MSAGFVDICDLLCARHPDPREHGRQFDPAHPAGAKRRSLGLCALRHAMTGAAAA